MTEVSAGVLLGRYGRHQDRAAEACNGAPDGRSGWRIEDENGVKRIRGNDGNSGTLG
jgi:hypothetical protein